MYCTILVFEHDQRPCGMIFLNAGLETPDGIDSQRNGEPAELKRGLTQKHLFSNPRVPNP